ncbi:MAG: LexA family transcriptional regulator [Pyramidobacter porci]|uniref:XRE family transcriptional regulator n=1 Tax=Pyramidobacter porci TaxID=2605789 RepID=UPI002A749B05|nr:LexA family transcriptional regulator [Pyramidobacter porci]MDY2649103.1 LexA family transcriptional regulator [Pyramidobacter porci]
MSIAVGKMIAAERIKKGFSREQLAEKAEIATETLARYERGDRNPKPQIIERLADALSVSTDYLMGHGEQKTAPSPKEERGISNIQFDNIDYKVYVISMYDYSQLHLHGEEGLTMATDARLAVPRFQLLEIDDKNPPFAVRQDIPFSLTGRGISAVDGAVVINPRYTDVESGKIYLVLHNKELLLRQVSRTPDGGYILDADNGVHAEVSYDAVANGSFKIIGRAVMSTRGL